MISLIGKKDFVGCYKASFPGLLHSIRYIFWPCKFWGISHVGEKTGYELNAKEQGT